MRRFSLALLTILIIGLLTPCASAMSYTLQEILQHIAESPAMRDPVMGFQQHVEIRGPLFTRWEFVNTVKRDHDRFLVDVGRGAPGWMPTEATTDLIDMRKSIERFDFQLVGTGVELGVECYILQGTRKANFHTGAEAVRLWVEPEHWTVVRADLTYSWGRMEVRQWYRRLDDGRLVLDRQEAKAELPLWVTATLRIRYEGYWFEEQ